MDGSRAVLSSRARGKAEAGIAIAIIAHDTTGPEKGSPLFFFFEGRRPKRRIWGSRPNHPQGWAFGPHPIWGSRPNPPQCWAFGPHRIWGSRPNHPQGWAF